jgi:hypothetical protein
MALFRDMEPREVPHPEGSDPKEVFAFFGLCSYCLQVLEQGLINLAVALRIRGLTRLTDRDFVVLFEEMGRKTLGQLIGDVRRQIDVSSDLEDTLRGALHDRNYIAHQFFAIHDIDFASDRGRTAMINELRQITKRIQAIDRQLESVTHPLFERLGLTAEMVQKELVKMNAEAKQQNIPS